MNGFKRWPYTETPKPLKGEAFLEMFNRYRDGDKLAEDYLILSNSGLVLSLALKKHAKDPRLSVDELCQEGVIGIQRALQKFNPERGNKFSTYAIYWIRQAMQRALYDKGGAVRRPVHHMDMMSHLTQVALKFERAHGRSPTVAELAEMTGYKPRKVEEALVLNSIAFIDSLDAPIFEEGSPSSLLSIIPNGQPSALDGIVEADVNSKLMEVVESTLGDRDREIIRRFCGFGGEGQESLTAIGDDLGLSRERVRQLKNRALRELKRALNARSLR